MFVAFFLSLTCFPSDPDAVPTVSSCITSIRKAKTTRPSCESETEAECNTCTGPGPGLERVFERYACESCPSFELAMSNLADLFWNFQDDDDCFDSEDASSGASSHSILPSFPALLLVPLVCALVTLDWETTECSCRTASEAPPISAHPRPSRTGR